MPKLTDTETYYRTVESEWLKYSMTEHYKQLRNRIVQELNNSSSHCQTDANEVELRRNQGAVRAYNDVLRFFKEVVEELKPEEGEK